LYLIEVKNQNEELVALFKGTCFRTEKDLLS
jgi:acyl-CoA thioesterase